MPKQHQIHIYVNSLDGTLLQQTRLQTAKEIVARHAVFRACEADSVLSSGSRDVVLCNTAVKWQASARVQCGILDCMLGHFYKTAPTPTYLQQ